MDTRHVDQALTVLDTRKTQWARLPIRDKIGYLRQIQQLALTHAQRWADAETKAKQLRAGCRWSAPRPGSAARTAWWPGSPPRCRPWGRWRTAVTCSPT